MRHKKSSFAVVRSGYWWVYGVGWVAWKDIDFNNKPFKGASSNRPGPRTLKGAQKMINKEPSGTEICAMYYRANKKGKGWIMKYDFEKQL